MRSGTGWYDAGSSVSNSEGTTQTHRRSVLRLGAVGAVGAATVVGAASPAAAATSVRPYLNVTLKKGSRGTAVKVLQAALRMPSKDRTGYFGAKTYAAVVKFQKRKHLRANGVVNNATWRAVGGLPTAAAERAAKAKAEAAARAKAEAAARAKAEAAKPKPMPHPSSVALASPLVPDITGCTTTPEWVMARRVALGTSYVVADEIKKVGLDAWLAAQFRPDTIAEPFIETVRGKYPGVWMTDDELSKYLPIYSGVPVAAISAQLRRVHVLRFAYTKRHLQTAMADFWLDYFSFPYSENKVFRAARELDKMARELAFKPFPLIYQRFIASGGMFQYLDQYTSVKAHPGENLAREMMELYSVGVGNYTEADIKAAAKLLTGTRPGVAADGSATFSISEQDHYFGAVTIRGKQYANKEWGPAGSGAAQVAADIRRFMIDLATDPLTVRRVCTRLAQRFVADQPPASMISAMISAWNASGGDIEKVLRAMFVDPGWLSTAGHKWRRPAELWGSLAATAQVQWTYVPAKDDYYSPPVPVTFDQILAAGQPVRDWPSPQGMPDSNTHWGGTSSMLGGFNAADMVINGTDPHLTCPGQWAQRLGITTNLSFEDAAVRIVERVTGFVVPTEHPVTRTVIKRLNDGTEPPNPKITLPSLAGVERAVHAAFTSPLMFLR